MTLLRAPSRRFRPVRRGRRAFTIVELLIAIGIVALLAAIVVSASLGLVAKSEERQTQNVLRLLDLALAEWETSADRKLTISNGGSTDLSYETRHVFTTTEMLRTIRRSPSSNAILAQIDPNMLIPIEDVTPPPGWVTSPPDPDPDFGSAAAQYSEWLGGLVVLDAWDTPIRAVHPGELATSSSAVIDPDGTERTTLEDIYGRTANRRVLFVSAGPDGKFGDISTPPDSVDHAPAEDNVYSYEGAHDDE